jgi:protein-disulfide isomerase
VSQMAIAALDQLMATYPTQVRLQFRNFPLSFHPQAELAHNAVMAAAKQGHFWEITAYIFDHQSNLREPDLLAAAGQLGLDQAQFASDVEKRVYAARVDADLEDGTRRGIHGSPVIFVNGKRIDGVPSQQMLTESVEAALAQAKTLAARPEVAATAFGKGQP